MSAKSMLAAARKDLGMAGRPNPITRAYAARNGDVYLEAPWCQMSVTEWARRSGNEAAVLPRGDRAYTVWSAEDGEQAGRWHAGTVANLLRFARPGAVVFFDWGGTNSIARIDHVGLIERVLPDGRVVTIEGNTANACKRRVRSASVIAGFWNPAYEEDIVTTLPVLREGDDSWDVKTIRWLLGARGYPPADLHDTEFTHELAAAVEGFQRVQGLAADSVVGPRTWAALLRRQ